MLQVPWMGESAAQMTFGEMGDLGEIASR